MAFLEILQAQKLKMTNDWHKKGRNFFENSHLVKKNFCYATDSTFIFLTFEINIDQFRLFEF